MNTMFETLLQLPLFQGLALEDLTSIVGKVKLHFVKHKAGETILKPGAPCDGLLFLLKGEVSSTTLSADASYSLTERVQAPYVVEPQSMFGMNTVYQSAWTAHTEVHTISVSKAFVMNNLFKYEIFRLNYMNIISNRAQNLSSRLWRVMEDNTERRIAGFILAHSERPAGEKRLKIKMKTLAGIINSSSMEVSRTLNGMQEQGLLELHRGEILIPDAELLL